MSSILFFKSINEIFRKKFAKSALNDDEAFFEVKALNPVKQNFAPQQQKRINTNSAFLEVSDISIDQPISDDPAEKEIIFEIKPSDIKAPLDDKRAAHLEASHFPNHPRSPVSAFFFSPPSVPVGNNDLYAYVNNEAVIPVAVASPNMLQFQEEHKSTAHDNNHILRDSLQRNLNNNQMHPLKRESFDVQAIDSLHANINSEQPDKDVNMHERFDNVRLIVNNKNIDHPNLNLNSSIANSNNNMASENEDADADADADVAALPKDEKNKEKSKSKESLSIDTPSFKASVMETGTSPEDCLIVFTGRIEQEQHDQLEKFFNHVVNSGIERVLCNMSELVSISSSGWGILVAEMQRLKKRRGNLFLCGLQEEVERVFKVLELDKLFSTFKSVAEALNSPEWERKNERLLLKNKMFVKAGAENNPASLSLEEKIHHIVAINPNFSIGRIRKLLKSDAYGRTKISGWKLKSKLQSMSLGTKEERYRFFRSS